MTSVVYVVPCSRQHVEHAAPARDFYESHQFRYTLAAAERMAAADGGRVLIMSAKYGLVEPTEVLAPYDVTVNDSAAIDQFRLAVTAITHGLDYDSDVYTFLPRSYRELLAEALQMLEIYTSDVYESSPGGRQGGIGFQRGVVRSCTKFYEESTS